MTSSWIYTATSPQNPRRKRMDKALRNFGNHKDFRQHPKLIPTPAVRLLGCGVLGIRTSSLVSLHVPAAPWTKADPLCPSHTARTSCMVRSTSVPAVSGKGLNGGVSGGAGRAPLGMGFMDTAEWRPRRGCSILGRRSSKLRGRLPHGVPTLPPGEGKTLSRLPQPLSLPTLALPCCFVYPGLKW